MLFDSGTIDFLLVLEEVVIKYFAMVVGLPSEHGAVTQILRTSADSNMELSFDRIADVKEVEDGFPGLDVEV